MHCHVKQSNNAIQFFLLACCNTTNQIKFSLGIPKKNMFFYFLVTSGSDIPTLRNKARFFSLIVSKISPKNPSKNIS